MDSPSSNDNMRFQLFIFWFSYGTLADKNSSRILGNFFQGFEVKWKPSIV